MLRWFTSFVLLLVIQPGLCQSPADYRFQHFGARDGLADDYVFSIAQDSLGYMWFQYYGGLTRFDGYNFKVYKYEKDDSLRSSLNFLLGRLASDANKTVWITQNVHETGSALVKHDLKTNGFVKYNIPLRHTLGGFCVENNTTLWISTLFGKGLHSYNVITKEFNSYLIPGSDERDRRRKNSIFDVDDMGSSLLLATPDGLWSFDKITRKFGRPPCSPKDSAFLYHSFFLSTIKGPEDKLAMVMSQSPEDALPGGIVILGSDLSVLHRNDFPPGFNLSSMDIDERGMVWLGTWAQGLYQLNPAEGSFLSIRHVPGDPYSLAVNRIHDVAVDRDQNVWVATDKGVSKLLKKSLPFANFEQVTGQAGIYSAKNRDFIVASKFKEMLPLNLFEIQTAEIRRGQTDSLQFRKLPVSISAIAIGKFHQGKNYLWAGTVGGGIIGYPANSGSMLTGNGTPIEFRHDPDNPNTIGSMSAPLVWEDQEENLWVGGNTGLSKIDLNIPYGREGSITNYKHVDIDTNSISSNVVFGLYPEDAKSFWVVTETGVDLFNRNSQHFEHVFKDREMPATIYKSADGTLLLGTMNGLYEATNVHGHYRFDTRPNWSRGEVRAIREDQSGRLWLLTSIGLVCYDRKQTVALVFDDLDGALHSKGIDIEQLHKTSQGIMVANDGKGISVFDPQSLQIDTKAVKPVLTRLLVNNKDPLIARHGTGGDAFTMTADISLLEELSLDYRHNNFTIEFSGLSMTDPENIQYRYKLEGFNNDWIEAGRGNRLATYINLDPGTYVFRVRASNHHGVWSDHETSLLVRIFPPPWKTWWAYTLYTLATLAIMLFWRNYDRRRIGLKHQAEHLIELDRVKSRFFSNISHEFRTPITLILGPLKDLLKQATDQESKAILGSMLRNGQRLLRLINQLLSLSRLEAGKMVLRTSYTDLVQMLREIGSSYESLAREKDIRYLFHAEVQELMGHFDEEKIEKIVHNILSNAFKFTREGGEVFMNLRVQEKSAVIAISDSGIGIAPDQLDKVFDRFYQVDNAQTRRYEGTGLGLALVKELAELHGGKVLLVSQEDSGSTFTVILPLDKVMPDMKEPRTSRLVDDEVMEMVHPATAGIEATERDETATTQKPILLIVEDNPDMRQYLHRLLQDDYKITEALNGKEGLKKARELVPDLILSDIMMPEMDGYKLCHLVKTNEITSHIPIILLTAKVDRESKMAGLEIRADNYLPKPFDADELRLIIRNQIEERRKMREAFSREISLEPKKISITSFDEKFLNRVLSIIEDHIGDEDFTIEELCREAGYSHMNFYRKIKALAGQTPSQFLRTIRLKRAAALLRNKSDNVTQIAYSVGFSSLSYFNKCFKEQFGITPGQIAGQGKEN